MSCGECVPLRPNGLADLSLETAKRRHVEFVLHYCGWNRAWAAQELGVNPSTMARDTYGDIRPAWDQERREA